jgi:hypothetical protein
VVEKSKPAGRFLGRRLSAVLKPRSKASALGINLCTGDFAEGRLYCAGVTGVLPRKGIRGH